MKKRLFLSIPLPENIKDPLIAFTKNNRVQGVRTVAENNLHITVCFFGDIDEANIPDLLEECRSICGKQGMPKFKFEEISLFPKQEPARMVWAHFACDETCITLVQKIRAMAEKKFRIQPEHGKFLAHVTLARIKDPRAAKEIVVGHKYDESFTASECHLMASELTPEGPIYTMLQSFALGKK